MLHLPISRSAAESLSGVSHPSPQGPQSIGVLCPTRQKLAFTKAAGHPGEELSGGYKTWLDCSPPGLGFKSLLLSHSQESEVFAAAAFNHLNIRQKDCSVTFKRIFQNVTNFKCNKNNQKLHHLHKKILICCT